MDSSLTLTKAYDNFFKEISLKNLYEVRTVYEHYVEKKKARLTDKTVLVLRIDVDEAVHLSIPLAKHLRKLNINASHFFLPHKSRYYNVFKSDLLKRIRELGHEVGLHYDHLYEELKLNKKGLYNFKKDVIKINNLIGQDIKGAVFHGHPQIDKLGRTNWELLKNTSPEELGLEYHDGLRSKYIKPNASFWEPDCDERITDFLGLPYSYGWNYTPKYPLRFLKKNRGKGKVLHVAFHTKNAFKYWKNWDNSFEEKVLKQENIWTFSWKKVYIFFRIYILKPIYERIKK